MRKILPVLSLIGFLVLPTSARAQAQACTVSVSPSSVVTSNTGSLNFVVTGSGVDEIGSLIFRSSNDIVLAVTGGSATGWNLGSFGSDFAMFSGGTLTGSDSNTFTVDVQAGGTVDSANFSVQASNSSGGDLGFCGDSVNIGVTAPVVAPVISNINLTVGNSSATLTWNTDVVATGVVNYGTSSGYGNSVTTASSTTHTATISSLSASTTYHYQIQVTGDATNSTVDATFTTSAASVTTTTTTTVTNTVTNTSTVNKTVILADTVKPVVKMATILDKAYNESPIIEGKVVDTGAVNVGIVKIQYSTDDGHSWLLVDEPMGASKVDFSFVPEVYEDGNYQILVRATDKSGNTGVSSVQTLIIDRLPPRIIHSLWRVGPIILSAPYQLIPGVPVQVTVQGIGGVTELSLGIGEEKFDLIKNPETGLWENEIVLQQAGNLTIIAKARDGGGNEIEQSIGEIELHSRSVGALHSGSVETQTTIYRYDELIHRFKIWNGEVYGQDNPSTGKNSWYLPGGKYYIEGKAKGYKTATTEIFSLDNPGVVAIEGGLEKWGLSNWWKRGKIRSQILDSRREQGVVLVGKQITWLEKSEWRGKEINLSVIPMWEPRLSQILGGLDEESVVVIPGANKSSVELLKSRGDYKMQMVADPDGEILSDLKEAILPITLVINRRGQVEGIH